MTADPNSHEQPKPSTIQSWTTPAPALVAVLIGGVVLAVAAVISDDGASRLLIGLAAVGLLGMAALGFRQRPRLSIVTSTSAAPVLVVRNLPGPTEYTREQITRARLVSYRRLGRRTAMLEIDVRHKDDERLLIFGRWDLGANPADVHEVVVEQLGLSGNAAS